MPSSSSHWRGWVRKWPLYPENIVSLSSTTLANLWMLLWTPFSVEYEPSDKEKEDYVAVQSVLERKYSLISTYILMDATWSRQDTFDQPQLFSSEPRRCRRLISFLIRYTVTNLWHIDWSLLSFYENQDLSSIPNISAQQKRIHSNSSYESRRCNASKVSSGNQDSSDGRCFPVLIMRSYRLELSIGIKR